MLGQDYRCLIIIARLIATIKTASDMRSFVGEHLLCGVQGGVGAEVPVEIEAVFGFSAVRAVEFMDFIVAVWVGLLV